MLSRVLNCKTYGVHGSFLKKLEQYFEEFLEIPHIQRQVKNAEYVVEKTKKAVELFNALSPQKKTIAAFHLTC